MMKEGGGQIEPPTGKLPSKNRALLELTSEDDYKKCLLRYVQ